MCKILGISRSLVYYEKKSKTYDSELDNVIISIFKASRNAYGTRKIKKELLKKEYQVSRRRISRIMQKYGLVSQYTVKQFKVHRAKCNEDIIKNEVKRKFDNRSEKEVVVSDLTYVNVQGKWHYICLLIDLYNREIIGHSAGPRKDINLVLKAWIGYTKLDNKYSDMIE
jgi:transposase InsO family protein